MTITEHVAKLLLSLTVTRRKLFENFNLKNHAAEYLSIKIIYSYIVKLSFLLMWGIYQGM